MSKPAILITGGAGYIGSYVNKLIADKGYPTVVLDNLERGDPKTVVRGELIKGDIQDTAKVCEIIEKHKVQAILHFAAFIDVGESVSNPMKYYENNVAGTLSLLKAALAANIKSFIFSSTAAVYGIPTDPLVSENFPLNPINPYGESKLMVEKILKDVSKSSGLKYTALRYFNAAGGDPDGEIIVSQKGRHNLIPKTLLSILEKSEISIYGTDYDTPDGTCIRDYIHLHDLATAHLLALEKLLQGGDSSIYNLGNGSGFSVKEVLKKAEEVTGEKLRVKSIERRVGDPPFLVADAKKAKSELGWKPVYGSLEKIISDSWKTMNPLSVN